MNNSYNYRQHSQLARRLLLQYTLSVLGLLAAAAAAYVLAYFFCTQMFWHTADPLYQFLKLLQRLAPVLIALIMLVGTVALTGCFLGKALQYMDEVAAAARHLAQPTDETITLRPGLQDVENELNLAREQALRNAAAAREAEQRKNDLVVYLAHDLKTPLTSVIGYLTLLQEEPQISAENRARYTGIALAKAERLEELINEFFDITRFNLTTLTLETENVNLTRMLEQITYEFNPVLRERNLRWENSLAPDVQLNCDPDKLERVFDNLLRNAVSYSYADAAIAVTLEKRADAAVVRVSNHGRTIPPEKLARIFEQFFRVDSSRASATGGAGLGLAIAREIVGLHGGTITAESADETVLFTVTLPFDRPVQGARPAAAQVHSAQPA